MQNIIKLCMLSNHYITYERNKRELNLLLLSKTEIKKNFQRNSIVISKLSMTNL